VPFASLLYVLTALVWSANIVFRHAAILALLTAVAAFALVQDPIGLIRPFDLMWRWIIHL
jgi:hypothetical protein